MSGPDETHRVIPVKMGVGNGRATVHDERRSSSAVENLRDESGAGNHAGPLAQAVP